MSQMIKYNGMLYRIDPKNPKKLQYSKNNGLSWYVRYTATFSMGEFVELMDNGDELFVTTTKGMYISKNGGLSFIRRNR